MNHVLSINKVSCFTQKHSVAKLLPTKQVTIILPRLKFLNAIKAFIPLMVFLIKSFIAQKSLSTWNPFRFWIWNTGNMSEKLLSISQRHTNITEFAQSVKEFYDVLFSTVRKDLLAPIVITVIFKLPFVAVRSHSFGTAKHVTSIAIMWNCPPDLKRGQLNT